MSRKLVAGISAAAIAGLAVAGATAASAADTSGGFDWVTAASESSTGSLPEGRVAPMERFRVGPFFGAVGGPHTGGVHSGLDMGADAGTPIHAVEGGKVLVAQYQGAAGLAVTIRTRDGHRILYGHMRKLLAHKGDRVETGEIIGRVGSTGNSTGPHLHLGVTRSKGSLMDPLKWMRVSASQLRAEGKR